MKVRNAKVNPIYWYILGHLIPLALIWMIFMSLPFKWNYDATTIFFSCVAMPIAILMIITSLIVSIRREIRR